MFDDKTSADTSSSTELKAGHAPASKFLLDLQTWLFIYFCFFLFIAKVGGMRVGAARPRHTSQGDDKNAQGDQESSGDNAANQGENQAAGEGENDDQESGFVCSIHWAISLLFFFVQCRC